MLQDMETQKILGEFKKLNDKIETMGAELRTEFRADLKTEIGGMKEEIGSLKDEMGNIKGEIGDLKHEIRGVGVLVEEVQGTVQLLAEQYGDIKETLTTHSEMIAALTEDVTVLKIDMSILRENSAQLK